ncbi:MAG: lipid A core--O-antigen ligase, partial [Candidatus Electrothrix sp. ATG1]|nr:lipid A core--O-antigen ligase [Candidatus Electrothrix sp. ATG1]
MKKKRDVSFFLFLLTLFFAPLAFGTTETWSMVMVELLVALTCLLFFSPFCNKTITCYRVPGLLPLLLLLGWMLVQTLPLPVSMVRMIAPNIFQAYQPVLDLPGSHTVAGYFDTWIPLTVYRKGTLFEVVRVSSYVLFYVVSVQLLTNSRKLLITVQAVSALGVGIAFLAILQRVTAPDTLFWFRKLSEGKTAFGPWVYKNHYAGFMVMLCPLVVAQFLLNRPPMDRLETFREKIALPQA